MMKKLLLLFAFFMLSVFSTVEAKNLNSNIDLDLIKNEVVDADFCTIEYKTTTITYETPEGFVTSTLTIRKVTYCTPQ